MRRNRRIVRRGLNLVEVVISTMLVSITLIGAMQCVGAAFRSRGGTGDSISADQLADQMLSEILEQEYEEPDATPLFGPESPEVSSSRAAWDDVDDYQNWTANPPQDRSGAVLPNLTGWQRDVLVELVDPNNPAVVVGSDQGVKRITVTVLRNGQSVATRVGLRSDRLTGN